jgi:glutaconate CoA-transferase subunit B
MKETNVGYSYKELMVVVLSRDLKDGELGHVGIAGGVPTVACYLAQKTHAPNLNLIITGYLNPKPLAIYPGASDDYRNFEGAEAMMTGYDTFSYTEAGFIDFMFYSGLQIDMYGNFNLTFIGGTIVRPKFRGPGIPNTGLSVTAKRFYLYQEAHTKRTFVEKVAFISGSGNLDGVNGRKKAGIKTEGPKLCVTPLSVMDFDEQTGRMRLRSIHEGVSLENVVMNTGFELIIPDKISITPPPTEEELLVLRNEIDTLGTLRL